MKKLFIAILGVAAFAACSQEMTLETPKGAAIGFDNVFVENATKAADLNKDNINDFGVYGFIKNASGEGKIFDNQTVAKVDGAFTYSPAQYWVGGATYSFSALVPKTGAKWTYTATDSTNGSIYFDNAAAAANQDLLFAFDQRETPGKIEAAPAAVAFTFNHVLSRVKFSFKNGFAEGQNITLKVTNVHITNAAANGTLALENGVLAADWANQAGELDVKFGDAGAAALAVNAKGVTEHFYLIPADAAYNVTFDVEIFQSGVSVDKYARTATVSADLERGKSYDFQATLTQSNTSDDGALYPIEFTVGTVNGWENYTGADVTVPDHVASNAAELAAAVAEGGVVALTADINLDVTRAAEPFVVANDVVIDGAGYTITSTAARAFNISGAYNVVFKNFTLKAAGERGFNLIQSEGANVTIENVTATAANYTVNVAGSATNANVTIKNSNLTGLNTVNVRGAGANVAIENTNITTIDNAAEAYTSIVIGYDAPNSVVNVKGGNIEITGSDVNSHGYDVQGENSAINFDGTTGSVTAKGSNYYIDYGINQYTFATLAAALAKAVDGETITLIHDVTETANNVNTKNNITLDLGGHTLTVAGLDVIDNTGKMTVCNGNIVANNTENTRRCIYNHGEMVINGVNFVQTYNQKGAAINNEGKLTINNATVNAVYYSVWCSGADSETVINGGTFTTTNNVELRDTWAYAVLVQNGAKLTVNGGAFTGNHGVIAAYGANSLVTVNGGAFNCTATYTGNSDWVFYTEDATIRYDESECTITSANPSGNFHSSQVGTNIIAF